jgi:hypothetical protein
LPAFNPLVGFGCGIARKEIKCGDLIEKGVILIFDE